MQSGPRTVSGVTDQGGEPDTFSAAVTEAIHQSRRTPREVGEEMGWTADYVLKIGRGERTPAHPVDVFAFEAILGVQPGELSRHLGYLPVGATPSVVAAIEADQGLTPEGRRHLIALYREARRG